MPGFIKRLATKLWSIARAVAMAGGIGATIVGLYLALDRLLLRTPRRDTTEA